MSTAFTVAVEPFIKRNIFASEDQAIQELVHGYVLHQIIDLQRTVQGFEKKYGMHFDRFVDYLHVRSTLLESGRLSEQQRQTLGQAIMHEEDDWIEWKAAQEMLKNWLGLRQEVGARWG